jgi:hypothetical protein
LITDIELEDLGYREPGMVLANFSKPGKKENANWAIGVADTLMCSKDGTKKDSSVQEAVDDFKNSGGVYVDYSILRKQIS